MHTHLQMQCLKSVNTQQENKVRLHNPKNPLVVNKQKTNAISVPMVNSKSSGSTLKFATPEIRVGLDAAAKSNVPKNKKVIVNKK